MLALGAGDLDERDFAAWIRTRLGNRSLFP